MVGPAEPRDMRRYFSGEALYGDDFTPEQIEAWFADEAEGYAQVRAAEVGQVGYPYHAWNRLHGFRYLGTRRFDDALGFGSADGEEFKPIIDRIGRLTIVDPSASFRRDRIHGLETTYVNPAASGDLPMPANRFDLITCLGVLHHIPNVSHVVGELGRVLKPGGHLILREPINSMGDWRQPRPGLTKRERGIPIAILERMIAASGLAIARRTLCGFALTPHLTRFVRPDPYNSAAIARADALAARLFAWNVNYHPAGLVQRFRPISAFYLLTKG